jgi:hypothetical protein
MDGSSIGEAERSDLAAIVVKFDDRIEYLPVPSRLVCEIAAPNLS